MTGWQQKRLRDSTWAPMSWTGCSAVKPMAKMRRVPVLWKEEEEKEIPRSGDIGDSQLHAIIPSLIAAWWFCLCLQVPSSRFWHSVKSLMHRHPFSLGDFTAGDEWSTNDSPHVLHPNQDRKFQKEEEALESRAGSELPAHRIESDADTDSSVLIRTSIEVFSWAPFAGGTVVQNRCI